MEDYAGRVETLPLTNGPAVFGLHPNAEIGYFTDASKELWSNLIDLQPRTGGGGGGLSREDYIAGVVKDIAAKIPEPEDIMNIRKRMTAEGAVITPTQVVLLQELERWNLLVTCSEWWEAPPPAQERALAPSHLPRPRAVASSLVDLSRALNGEIGMSDSLEEVGSALFNGRIPAMWRSLSPATQKPLGSWMLHFGARHSQYRAWIESGEPGVMWLSGLHIPESYLSALVQTTCRRKNWPLDKSTLYTQVGVRQGGGRE